MSAILDALVSVILWAATLAGHSTPDTAWQADTASDWPRWSDGVAACTEEDGSAMGQPFPCRWESAHSGNAYGQSYTLAMPVCTLAQVAASDARHAAGLPALPATCDDAESLIPN